MALLDAYLHVTTRIPPQLLATSVVVLVGLHVGLFRLSGLLFKGERVWRHILIMPFALAVTAQLIAYAPHEALEELFLRHRIVWHLISLVPVAIVVVAIGIVLAARRPAQ